MSESKYVEFEIDADVKENSETIERFFVPSLYAILNDMPVKKGDKIVLLITKK